MQLNIRNLAAIRQSAARRADQVFDRLREMIITLELAPGTILNRQELQEMFGVSSKHVPPPPGIPAPAMWGDENVVRQRFGSGAREIKFSRVMCDFRYAFPPADVVQLFRDYFGPTKVAFSKLDAQGQRALAADLEGLWKEYNQATDGTSLIHAEYLEVHATRV